MVFNCQCCHTSTDIVYTTILVFVDSFSSRCDYGLPEDIIISKNSNHAIPVAITILITIIPMELMQMTTPAMDEWF